MRSWCWLILATGVLVAGPANGAVNARVDRPVLSQAETLRLTIESTGQGTADEPDFSVLRRDFEVLGTGRSTHVNIINGRMSSRTEWVVNLAPRSSGKLTIPPVPVGTEATRAISIEVREAPSGQAIDSEREVMLEVEVDEPEPYLLAQVVYTVRLLYSAEVASGQLSSPEADGAVIRRLGEDARFQTRRDGRPYWTLERRYAVFPQTAGDVLIKSPTFRGDIPVKDRNQNSSFDAFGAFERFFQRTRPVRESGPDVTLTVQLPPASLRGPDWLPAKHLTLTEAWEPDPPLFRVGEPVTRNVIITAWGADEAQLPTLELPIEKGFKAYPEKEMRDSRDQDQNLVSRRVQRTTLVPTSAGEFTLPELTLSWWDTAEGRRKVATLPARNVNVVSRTGSSRGGVTANATGESPAGQAALVPADGAAEQDSKFFWRRAGEIWPWLTAALLVAWLVTLWLWRRERGTEAKPPTVQGPAAREEPEALTVRASRSALDQACRADDARAARDAVLAWAAAVWHEDAPNTLVEFAARLKNRQAYEAIALLDRAIYTRNEAGWNGRRFWEAVSPVLKKPGNPRRKRRETPLPELSPRV
ncbi:MAG: BatD family protein [Gammaproteobacteria bacterium]|nr:BatD family protein [Gammaproteobacteria bacterium]MDJ0870443.1 BatD family protein [Gammaproteobacteria bacterium]